MQGIRPCPYCGCEVEVVKLVKRKNETRSPYRIECLRCRALVARGKGFPNETKAESAERIRQYKQIINERLYPRGSSSVIQSKEARERDYIAAKSSMIDKNDEFSEIHDASHLFGKNRY